MSELKIETLSKEDLAQIITHMDSGMTLDEAMEKLTPDNLLDLVISFHSLFCSMNHNEGGCTFYAETDWDYPAHVYWKKIVDRILNAYDNDCILLPDIMPYLWRIEGIKKEVEKEVAVGGLALFNYLLKSSF